MSDLGIYDTERQKWLQFDSDTEILIRLIPKKEMAAIGVKAKKEAKMSGFEFSDIFNRRFALVAVKGWRKIGDPSHPGLTIAGKPLAFTSENIAMLMERSLKFSNFVNNYAIDEDEFQEGCEETKNAS